MNPGSDAREALGPELARNLIERVCVGDITTRGRDLFPDKATIVFNEQRVSYRELDSQTNQLARAFLEQGLNPGDPVCVVSRNCMEVLIIYLACAKAGLVFAPLNPALRTDELAYCLNDSEARVLLAQGSSEAAIAAIIEHTPVLERICWFSTPSSGFDFPASGTLAELVAGVSDDPVEVVVRERESLQLLYTSGTTSRPKGVLTNHFAATMAGLTVALANGMTPGLDNSVLVCLPLFHCAMLNGNIVPTLMVGGTVVLMDGFEAEAVASTIDQLRIAHVVLLPVMYAQLLELPGIHSRNFDCVIRAGYAMTPMPEQRLTEIHNLFPNADVVLGAGQTEFTPPTCKQRAEHQWDKAASWGTATAMTRIGIMDEGGRLLGAGEMGEIVYRGPQIMNEYLNRPEENATAFRHGWFHSGDIGWLDNDGVVWFSDRKKDVIKTGGENVASLEVERCLLDHPGVADAAVVGVYHPRWGEAITAVVTAKAGRDIDVGEVLDYCRSRLAGFKVPKSIVVKDELPRTGTGKIQKHIIRNEVRDLYASPDK
jgi:acyl-CoA synthetase (AMP-forming)/AMP-acid ligase II